MKRLLAAYLFSTQALACAHDVRPSGVWGIPLTSVEGTRFSPEVNAKGARFTVIEFFSTDCPVQKAHDLRLIELYRRYRPRGVQFFAVDSEVVASSRHDAIERQARGYPFPIFVDENGRFADALGVSYSTFTIIVDHEGVIRYQGGIDSDRVEPRPDAKPYLQNALDDLLSGKAPRQAVGNVFGCMLRRW